MKSFKKYSFIISVILLNFNIYTVADRNVGKYFYFFGIILIDKKITLLSSYVTGAIFDDGSFLHEAVFDVAIKSASENQENPFVANVIKTSPGDIVEAENALCSLLEVSNHNNL